MREREAQRRGGGNQCGVSTKLYLRDVRWQNKLHEIRIEINGHWRTRINIKKNVLITKRDEKFN